LIVLAEPALASERLVMSYECRATPRELVLIPSEPREYPILGRREEILHTACSPVDENRCRTWRLHRFDIDCGGERVPWLDVAGASAHQKRYPAKVRNGRMIIGLGSAWARPSDGPGRYGYRGPMANGGPFRPGPGPERAVELPPGFAPTLGIDARFIQAPVARHAPPPIDPAQIAPPVMNPARHETALPAEKPPEPVPAQRPPRSEEARAEQAKNTDELNLDAGKSTAAGPPVTILNAAPSERTKAPAAATQSQETQTAQSTKKAESSAESTDSLAVLPAVPAPDKLPAIPPPDSAPASTHQERFTTTVAGALIGLAALAAIALGAFMASRPRSGATARRVAAPREFASVSLGGGSGANALVVTDRRPAGTQARGGTASAPTLSISADTDAAAPAGGDSLTLAVENEAPGVLDWLPETHAEALALIGASPEAPLEVVKKIVDGLRQSWHPDLARNELDRIVREKRTTQLNVAWDLIAARSQAA